MAVARYRPQPKVISKGLLVGQMSDQIKQLSHQPRNQHYFFNNEWMPKSKNYEQLTKSNRNSFNILSNMKQPSKNDMKVSIVF